MNFRQFIEFSTNVNTRAINPSGGAGIGSGPASPQKGLVPPQSNLSKKKGGAFGGGNDSLKDILSSPFNVTSKDSPADLKKFAGRPPSPFSGTDISPPGFKPPAGPHLPGVIMNQKSNDPTRLKGNIPPPKI